MRSWFPILVVLAATSVAPALANPDQPNIIFIVLDDADYHDFGFNSQDAQTPNIDALSANGIVLSRFYTAGAKCSPTRASLLTGMHPLALGLNENWVDTTEVVQGRNGLRGLPSPPQLGTELTAQGYATAHFGKWHIGQARTMYLPDAHGFPHWLLPKGGYTGNQRVRSHLGDFTVNVTYRPTWLTDQVLDYLDTEATAPFFINVWYLTPHTPLHVPPGFDNQPFQFDLTSPRGMLLAMMQQVDLEIGRIVQKVTDLGLRDNTLLIVTSDNGGQAASNAAQRDFRGTKGNFLEGGIHVPFAAQWPACIPSNTVNQSLVTSMDMLPTLMDIAGASDEQIAGISALGHGSPKTEALLNQQVLPHADILWHMKHVATPSADRQAEYTYALRSGHYKLIKFQDRTTYNMYDLASDPYEGTNLVASMPELFAEMHGKLLQHRQVCSRVPLIPWQVNQLQTIPFDPRFDICGGDLTFVTVLEIPSSAYAGGNLIRKPGSFDLRITPETKVALTIDGVSEEGTNSVIDLLSAPLTPGIHEIALGLTGHRRSNTVATLYVDGMEVDVFDQADILWILHSNTSDLVLGDDTHQMKGTHFYLTRFWPEEWRGDPPSTIPLEVSTHDDTQTPAINWEGEPGFDYQLEVTENYLSWTNTLPGSFFTGLSSNTLIHYDDPVIRSFPGSGYRLRRSITPLNLP